MANYHPSDELLMQFAAGQAPNALGLLVACHNENCAQCRSKTRLYEQLGGDILTELSPEAVSNNLLDRILGKLDEQPSESNAPTPLPDTFHIPRPLQRFVNKPYDELDWSGMTRSIKEIALPFSDDRYTAKLYKISAGKELPEHTHKGNEFTLVMEGSFCDKAGDYHAGDFVLADTQTIHQPRANSGADCICFAVVDAPLKFTGLFGRMLNPFIG